MKLFMFSGLFTFLLTGMGSHAQVISDQDIAMAKEVIHRNTRTIPGFGVGSQVKVSSGEFSPSDALVIFLLKFHQQKKICPPIVVVGEILKKLSDSEISKKSVAVFWQDYSSTSNLDQAILKPDFLEETFEWYILTKQTERLKISNFRMEGYVASDEAWRKAMDSQRKFWEKSASREDEFILHRDANRVILNAEAAIHAAQRAVSGSL